MRHAGFAGTRTRAPGRGVAAIFDVPNNDTLHRVLNEWAEIIPAHFETYPLIERDAAKLALAGSS